jgi:hypothetical protein
MRSRSPRPHARPFEDGPAVTPARLATAALTAITLAVALAAAAPTHADPVLATGSAGDVTA